MGAREWQNVLRGGKKRWLDWALCAALMASCWLIFLHGDLLQTAGSSISLLNGHILDFYDYNELHGFSDVYMPTTYLLFAIWGLPLKLLGLIDVATTNLSMVARMYYKLLPVGAFLLAGVYFYKTAKQLTADDDQARFAAFLWLTTPIAFFSPLIFGQYDALTVCAVVIGFYYYVQDDMVPFTLWFALAITMKYYALAFYLPLIFLHEKKISRLFLHAALLVLPFLAEALCFWRSTAFRYWVFGFGPSKGDYLFSSGFATPWGTVSYFLLLIVTVSVLAFMKEAADKDEEVNYAIFYCSLAGFAIFGTGLWHPQWVIAAMPFMVYGTLRSKRADVLMLVDLVLMALFSAICATSFPHNVDQTIAYGGILGSALPQGQLNKIMASFFPSVGYFGLFSCVLFAAVLLRHPRNLTRDWLKPDPLNLRLARIRFIGGLACFIVPAALALGSGAAADYPASYDKTGTAIDTYTVLSGDAVYEQPFVLTQSEVHEADVYLATYARLNYGTVTVQLLDGVDGNVIAASDCKSESLKDNSIRAFVFDIPQDYSFQKGKTYSLRLFGVPTDPDKPVTGAATARTGQDDTLPLLVNGEETEMNLQAIVK